MNQQPITLDLPHSLGAEEAKRRMQASSGKLKDYLPGGDVQSRWEGDRMYLNVRAMGQAIDGHIDVRASDVHLELMLPPMLAMLAGTIKGVLQKEGGRLLEDKSKRG